MLSADILKGVDCKRDELVRAALSKLTYPLLASPKIDGYRAILMGQLLSRQLKAIRNIRTQAALGVAWDWAQGLDGELVVGPPNAEDVFRTTSSGITSYDGDPKATFWVFDTFHERYRALPFRIRCEQARRVAAKMKLEGLNVKFVQHTVILNVDDLLKYEARCLTAGYEGAMVRHPSGPYKQGRATLTEGWLHKVKRFVDDEAEIIGFTEQMHNANELTTNERGYAKRSSHKANKHGKDTFGAFICRTRAGVEFQCGSGKGMTDELRAELWRILNATPKAIIGRKWLKFSYLPVGVKEKPRHPKYLALLDKEDVPT